MDQRCRLLQVLLLLQAQHCLLPCLLQQLQRQKLHCYWVLLLLLLRLRYCCCHLLLSLHYRTHQLA